MRMMTEGSTRDSLWVEWAGWGWVVWEDMTRTMRSFYKSLLGEEGVADMGSLLNAKLSDPIFLLNLLG